MNSPLRRTKSRFFDKNKARDPATLASVVAFTAWRLGLNTIKRMRSAQFEIEASPQYFEVLRHFVISHELADVRECLFVPLPGALHGFTNPLATRNGEKYGIPLRYSELADSCSWDHMQLVLQSAFK